MFRNIFNSGNAMVGAGTGRVPFRPDNAPLNITRDTPTDTDSQGDLFGIDLAHDWDDVSDLPELTRFLEGLEVFFSPQLDVTFQSPGISPVAALPAGPFDSLVTLVGDEETPSVAVQDSLHLNAAAPFCPEEGLVLNASQLAVDKGADTGCQAVLSGTDKWNDVPAFEDSASSYVPVEGDPTAAENLELLPAVKMEGKTTTVSTFVAVEEDANLKPAAIWMNSKMARATVRRRVKGTKPTVYGTVGPRDIIKGRGGNVNTQNRPLMSLVRSHKELYEQAKKDKDDRRKREIGAIIVAAIQRKGGRFLHQIKGPVNNSVEWVEMSDDKAISKVMATMRDEISRGPI
jgi:hypothetical protein